MRIAPTFNVAYRALRRNKMRSVLTALGIIIGVEAQIASLGENVILIFSGSTTSSGIRTGWGGAGTLKIEDAEAIRREVPGVISVSEEVVSTTQVAAGNQNWFTRIYGESADYFDIRQWPLADGVPFTVLGVLTPKGLSPQGVDQDDIVVMPYTSAMKRVIGGTTLRNINAQIGDARQVEAAQQQIISLLRQRHNIRPGRDDDFTVRTQQEIADAATSTSRVMTVLLGAIAGVSLLVGGIGIMNIMLVSVTERTREIGVRMAVGAHGNDILTQFLIEAVTLSSVGGVIGIVCGIGASRILSAYAHWPTLISLSSILIAFLFSAAVGVFFGFYPARQAARLDPIEALRYE